MSKLWNSMKKKTGRVMSLILSIAIVLTGILLYEGESLAAGQLQESESILAETEQAVRELLLWQCEKYSVPDTQALLDDIYAADAANGVILSYVMGIRADRKEASDYDFSGYGQALYEAMQSTDKMSASTRQKAAIVLELLGMNGMQEEAQVTEQLYKTIGQDGIMTEIYGLLMLHSCQTSDGELLQQTIFDLVERQLQDGGFAVSGTEGDVDVTAMALRALAPYYVCIQEKNGQEENGISAECQEAVQKSVNLGLDFLSGVQLADGAFESYGSKTSESTSQVILCLTALGKNPLTEEAFIKNGNSPYDDLMRYRCSDGGFSHTLSAAANDMATSQALCALTAIREYMGAENPDIYYVSTDFAQAGTMENKSSTFDYRVILSACILVLAIGYLLIRMKGKSLTKRRLISLICIVVISVSAVWMLRIQTKEQYRNDGLSNGQTENITVFMQIRCDTVAGAKADIPEDGVILARCAMNVPQGTSVFEVLKEACRLYDIQLEYEGGSVAGSFAYVEGINYLYEYDFGDLSGWMYQVDGEFPSVGSGEYRLEDKQEILWVYTQELGKDVGADEIP